MRNVTLRTERSIENKLQVPFEKRACEFGVFTDPKHWRIEDPEPKDRETIAIDVEGLAAC